MKLIVCAKYLRTDIYIIFVRSWFSLNILLVRQLVTSGCTIVAAPKEKKTQKVRENQEVPQSQTATLPRHQEEEETDKAKQAQIEQTYEKH